MMGNLLDPQLFLLQRIGVGLERDSSDRFLLPRAGAKKQL